MPTKEPAFKISLFSPFPLGENGYPHIDAIVNGLSILGANISVHHMPERGLFLAESPLWPSRNPLRAAKRAFLSWKNILSLIVKTASHCLKIRRQNPDVIICIDNFTYSLASLFCIGNVILWSLDFVGPDNLISNSCVQRGIKWLTIHSLAKKGLLIIQDQDRENDFLESLGPSIRLRLKSFYLPVCLQPIVNSSQVNKRNPASIPLLLQIGGINAKRSLSDQLIKSFQLYQEKFELYLHGFFSHEILSILRESEYIPFISSIALDPSQIPAVIKKCDIGLVFYGVDDLNFKSLANASNQLVEFLRCGKPVIAYGNASLCFKVQELGVGISISDLASIEDAVATIIKNYISYSDNCVQAFEKYYNTSTYLLPLLTYLERVCAVYSKAN